MERNDYLGYLFSVLFHGTLLFVVGLFFIQRMEYGMQSGAASTEVDLAEPPAPEPAPPEPTPPPPPVPEEMALPTPEAKPAPPPPIVAKPRPVAKRASASVGAPAPSSAGRPTQMAVPDYLSNPKPNYPAADRAAGHQGRVILRVRVSAEGRPESVSLLQSSGYSGLDQSALDAVRHWKFRPARIGPLAIPINADVPVNFVLKK